MSRGLSSSLGLLLATALSRNYNCLALVPCRSLAKSISSSSPSSSSVSNRFMSSSQSPPSSVSRSLRFVDIGSNLLEDRFTTGTYRGTYRHEPDLDLILKRAVEQGVDRIILTAGTVQESREAVVKAREWQKQYPEINFSCTVGVHPTRCQQEFVDKNADDEAVLQELLDILRDGMLDGIVVAVGEIGLDYDRLEFSPADVQKKYLIRQLQVLAATTGLPLFLHNRSVGKDLLEILTEYQDCWKAGGGVVHSFDDSLELAVGFMEDLDLYIGLNGCSLRTDESLAVVKELPLDKILLETDCPYCEVRKTHPGYQYIQTHFEARAEKKFERGLTVKSRIEPCHIVQVAEVVAGCKNVPVQEVANACYDNSMRLYRWNN
jgi:TatD DNase family protein